MCQDMKPTQIIRKAYFACNSIFICHLANPTHKTLKHVAMKLQYLQEYNPLGFDEVINDNYYYTLLLRAVNFSAVHTVGIVELSRLCQSLTFESRFELLMDPNFHSEPASVVVVALEVHRLITTTFLTSSMSSRASIIPIKSCSSSIMTKQDYSLTNLHQVDRPKRVVFEHPSGLAQAHLFCVDVVM